MMITRPRLPDVHTWPLASFAAFPRFGRYRSIADISLHCRELARSRLTQTRHRQLKITAMQFDFCTPFRRSQIPAVIEPVSDARSELLSAWPKQPSNVYRSFMKCRPPAGREKKP